MNEEIQKELLKLLNNPRTGLKDSSSTNKTRYAILALFEESLNRVREEEQNKFRKILNSGKQMYEIGKKEGREEVLKELEAKKH